MENDLIANSSQGSSRRCTSSRATRGSNLPKAVVQGGAPTSPIGVRKKGLQARNPKPMLEKSLLRSVPGRRNPKPRHATI